jgi:hypothetical protein
MSKNSNPAYDATFALALHRFLIRFAQTSISAFLWVTLFLYFADVEGGFQAALVRTLLLYALAQTVTLVAAPFALRIIGGNMLRGLVFGTLFCATSLVYAGALVSGVFDNGAAIVGILLGLYSAFYRAPYQLMHDAFTRWKEPLFSTEVLLALSPLVGALLACGVYGYPYILFVAGAITSVSMVFLLFAPNVFETYSWDYRQTYTELLATKNQELVVGSMLAGTGGALLFLIWPLILVFSLSPEPLVLGAAFAGALLILLIIRSRRAHPIIYQHADNATYVDEYTVLKEMSLAAGRLMVSLTAAIAIGFLM